MVGWDLMSIGFVFPQYDYLWGFDFMTSILGNDDSKIQF